MRCFRNRLLLIFMVVGSLLVGVGFNSRPIMIAAPASGPDFRRSDSDLSHPLRMIVYGDTRFTDPRETSATNPKVRRWLVNQIAAEKPDAVLLSGDLPWHGGQAGDYDEYRSETQIWRDEHLHVYPALGNHELSGGSNKQQCVENWWKAFPELRGRRWYSVQLGSSLYVLNLDSNSSLLPGSDQIGWIQAQLANLPATVRFVFFNLHHPPVVDVQENGDASHNGRPNEHALAEFLAKAPEKSRVRFVVVAGHIHNYERFFQDDIVYLVSGGGGAQPRPIVRGPADLYQDSAFPNYHYVRFVQSGEGLTGTMVRVADPDGATPVWQEKDHFEIRATGGYHLVAKYPFSAAEGSTREYFDYITVDPSARRVYLSHGTEIKVIDADNGRLIGNITGLKQDHGVAIASEFGRGFITDGAQGKVIFFDLNTLKVTGEVKADNDADSVVYDPASKRVFAMNGDPNSSTVIDAKSGAVVGTIKLGGAPEFAVADGRGTVYVNMEDKNEVVAIDSLALTIKSRRPVAPAGRPTALAMDTKHRRLFSAGRNPQMLVAMDADSGKVIQSFPISAGVDAAAYEPDTGMIFCSTREGMIHIFHEDSPDKFSEVETVKTEFGAKTMGLDTKTHDLFLDTADFGPPATSAAGQPRPQQRAVPGTFRVLVYGR